MATEILPTPIDGVYELTGQVFQDKRGYFLNAFRYNESAFSTAWGQRRIAQVNLSITADVGVIRGLHIQSAPYSEAKIVRCLKGKVWDVAVDLRPASKTYGCWHSVELTPLSGNALLIPEGCAHGFQALEPDSELLYLHSQDWVPEAETGVRWNDPLLSIDWPLPPRYLSTRDLTLPLLHGCNPYC